jgi:hypothetical protein
MAPVVIRSLNFSPDASPGHDDTEEEDEDEEYGRTHWRYWYDDRYDTCESDWSDSEFPQLEGNWTLTLVIFLN